MTAPTNGEVSVSVSGSAGGSVGGSNTYGDTVTFTCDTGYNLVGAATVTCRADGSWSGRAPTCTDATLCPAGYLHFNGTCLRFSDERKTYAIAREICQAEDAHLVVIKTAALDNFIVNRIKDESQAETWIGLDDLASHEEFAWADDSVLSPGDYNYVLLAPNRSGNNDNDHCVEIRPQWSYKWNDHVCSESKYYVCQKANHAFEVLRTANQQYRKVDFLVIKARLPANGQSVTLNWCADYRNLCAKYGRRPTGCGENAVQPGTDERSAGRIRCVTEYNSDPYINNVLAWGAAARVAEVANLAFSAGATAGRSFGFLNCATSSCQRGIRESHWSLFNTTAAFLSDGSGDRIVYTVCAGSVGNDECATGNGGCAHVCIHTQSGHRCICRKGFSLMEDGHGCEDIDECAKGNGGCVQTCSNTHGAFLCSCHSGYTLNGDGLTCDDVNECEVSPGICGNNAECVNLNGSVDCKCSPGFKMGTGGCKDVDECSGKHTCPEHAFCVNGEGSYHCVCLEGFTGNGTTCTEIVPTTTPASPTTTVKSTTATPAAESTALPTHSPASTDMPTSSAAPSTTSTAFKTTATTQQGDAIGAEGTTTGLFSKPTATFLSHATPGANDSSPRHDGTINTITDLQYDKDDPGSLLDQLIPHKKRGEGGSSPVDGTVDSATCTEAMAALARLSRAPAAEDATETMAMITSDVITLCGKLPLDAQAEGGYVVGAMTDSIKQAVRGGASMEELSPKAAAVVDTVAALMEAGGSEAVPEDEEDAAALDRLPPRKREEFRQQMKEKHREKLERQWAYQRETTQALKKNLDSIADTLLDSKGSPGRVELGSKAVQMVLEKTSGGGLGGAAVSAHAGGVTFPGPHALHEGGVAEDADMKVVGYARNPFVWDDSAKDVKSSVVDIELKQPGRGTLRVKDLPEDITVVLKNDPDLFATPRLVRYSPFPNDTMVFRTFRARRNQTYGVAVSLVAPYPAAVMYGKLGDFPNETDYDFKKEFSWDDFVAKTVPPYDDDVHTTYTILQPDPAVDNGTEDYTIGLQVDDCPASGCPYTVDIVRLNCVFWDPGIDVELGSWKGDGCRVSPASTLPRTVCMCDHLTSFGTSSETEPNRINFKTVFKRFVDLVNNYAVWTTMVVLMGMYFVMLYPARRNDKIDAQKWSVKNVHGNRESHPYRYLIRVDTGHDWGAGTRSKVAFVLNGALGSTGPREFQQDDMTFQTGGVNTFLLTTPEQLGCLTSLTVWHDNSGVGRHASWFLERVEVTDLQINKKTQFVCNGWMGVEHGDGRLVRTMPPTEETDVSLGQRFSLKLREKFKDGHVWMSVVTSRPRSYFTRVQRLSCCICLLFCKMITSAMWFRGSEQGTSTVVLTIGSIELTADTLLVSLWTTLQVFPVNFIIVQIFRRWRPKGVPKSSGRKLPYWFLYVGWALLALTTLASGFFLLLYSVEWGKDKSVQWLTAFGLAFLQSMVVVQPAQAIILAFGTSILLGCRKKKSDTDEKDEDVEAGRLQPVDGKYYTLQHVLILLQPSKPQVLSKGVVGSSVGRAPGLVLLKQHRFFSSRFN
ncbi:uncharacterized protein [Branchiostoma lanceolatum]|uniref:uncharacterized protein n=1 Tax=Branchiostoma lanceolatum TaxID=7740 RepID=UPI0034555164